MAASMKLDYRLKPSYKCHCFAVFLMKYNESSDSEVEIDIPVIEERNIIRIDSLV